MTLQNMSFSAVQWTDLHQLSSRFAKTLISVNNGRETFSLSSMFGYQSTGAVSVGLVSAVQGHLACYRFGYPKFDSKSTK